MNTKQLAKTATRLIALFAFVLLSSCAQHATIQPQNTCLTGDPVCLPPEPSSSPLANLARQAVVTVSSTAGDTGEDSRWTKERAVDGMRDSGTDESYGWSSARHDTAEVTEWLQLDFGMTKSINRVDLYPRNDETYGSSVGDGFPTNFTIDVSEDGITWSAVVTQSHYPKPDDEVQSFSFARATGRFVRVWVSGLGYVNGVPGYHAQIAEIEIYDMPEDISHTFSNGETLTFTEDDGDILFGTGEDDEDIVFAELNDFETVLAEVEAALQSNTSGISAASIGTGSLLRLWPGDVVYYSFSPKTSEAHRQFIRNVITNHWNASSEIKWFEDHRKANRVIFKFKKRDFCAKSSHIGMRRERLPQKIKFSEACFDITNDPDDATNTILHEMGHAVGMLHEHQRCDRDNYLTAKNRGAYLGLCPGLTVGGLWVSPRDLGPYDFDSIMHYPLSDKAQLANPFGSTYWVGDPNARTIGRVTHLSCHDILGIHITYGLFRGSIPNSRGCNLARDPRTVLTVSSNNATQNSLVDGNRTLDGWSSATQPSAFATEAVVFQIPDVAGAARRISRIDVYPHSEGGFPVDFTLDYSPDGVSWFTSQNFSNYPNPGNTIQNFQFPPDALPEARFIRIQATRLGTSTGGYSLKFAEVELYGSPEGNLPAAPPPPPVVPRLVVSCAPARLSYSCYAYIENDNQNHYTIQWQGTNLNSTDWSVDATCNQYQAVGVLAEATNTLTGNVLSQTTGLTCLGHGDPIP